MEENTLSEAEQLKALRTGPVVEVTNNEPEVTNTEAPKTEDKTEGTPTDKPIESTETPVEAPYHEKMGFKTQAELDTFIESNKAEKKPTYTNKYAEELDNFTKATGKDDVASFNFYKSVEVKESMEPQDYIKLIVENEILNNPTLARFKGMREKELTSEYLVDMDEKEEGITENDLYQKEMKSAQLKKDAQKIIDEIKLVKEKMANNGLTEAEIEERATILEKTKTKLTEFSNAQTEAFEINIPDFKKNDKGEVELLKDDKGEPIILKNFTFDKDEKEFFKTTLDGILSNMGYPEPDSDNAKTAVGVARMATFDMFAPRLFKEVIAQTEARMIKEHNINVDNPSSKKVAAQPDNLEGVLSEEQHIKEVRKGG